MLLQLQAGITNVLILFRDNLFPFVNGYFVLITNWKLMCYSFVRSNFLWIFHKLRLFTEPLPRPISPHQRTKQSYEHWSRSYGCPKSYVCDGCDLLKINMNLFAVKSVLKEYSITSFQLSYYPLAYNNCSFYLLKKFIKLKRKVHYYYYTWLYLHLAVKIGTSPPTIISTIQFGKSPLEG